MNLTDTEQERVDELQEDPITFESWEEYCQITQEWPRYYVVGAERDPGPGGLAILYYRLCGPNGPVHIMTENVGWSPEPTSMYDMLMEVFGAELSEDVGIEETPFLKYEIETADESEMVTVECDTCDHTETVPGHLEIYCHECTEYIRPMDEVDGNET